VAISQSMYAGKTAVITGASSGMGRVFAERYAALGADVVLIARRKEKLEDIAHGLEAACGIEARIVAQDLCAADACEAVESGLLSIGKSADILVNCAGCTIAERFVDTEWPRQRDMALAMMVAVAGLCHATLPGMLSRSWGRIINVASNLAYAPGGVGHTQYPASKAYVMRFSQSLFQETHGSGVKVMATCPGATKTGFQAANGIEGSTRKMPGFMIQTPEQVVDSAIRANERGTSVHIPGWHNKLMVAAMQIVPDALMLPIVRMGSGKR